jgi:3-oxoacyl-[acyl-carrier-protein] synthase-3
MDHFMYRHVRIEALHHVMPPHRVLSSSLEEELKDTYARCAVPMGLIEGLVGVTARRFWDEGVTIDGLAADVVRGLLEQRPGVSPDMIVSTSVCKDYIEPSVAALVAGALNFKPECITFDVSNACLGFLTGIDLAARRIESGEIECAVVVAAESSRHVTRSTVDRLKQPTTTTPEFRESMPTLTLGSAAVAMLLVHERVATTNHRVNGMVTLGDPQSSRICLGTPEWMKTDGQALLKNGVELAARTWATAAGRFGWTIDGIDQFLCHQVGARHISALTKRLEIPQERVFLTFPELGNTGPAAVPMAMSLAVHGWEHSPPTIREGSRLALLGIGSGLTVSMMDVVW